MVAQIFLWIENMAMDIEVYNSVARKLPTLRHFHTAEQKSIFKATLWRISFIMSPIKCLILTYLWINLCANIQFSCTGSTVSGGKKKWFSPISDFLFNYFLKKRIISHITYSFYFVLISRRSYLLRLGIEVMGRIEVSKMGDLSMDISWVWMISSAMVRPMF